MTAAVPDTWMSAETRQSLQYATDTVAELTGFSAGALNLVHGRDLLVVATTGIDAARDTDGRRIDRDEIIGSSSPVSAYEQLISDAKPVGAFYFLADQDTDPPDLTTWVTYRERSDAPNAWQDDDVLVAPLWTREGQLLGVLSLDDPVDGLRPSETRIRLLSRWVGYVNQVVLEALEREQLTLRSRLMAQTRRALRVLTATGAEPADLLAATREKLLAAFDADRVGIRTYADPVTGAPSRFTARADHPGGQEAVMAVAEQLGRQAWQRGEVPIFVAGDDEGNARAGFTPELRAWLTARGHVSMLMAPIGAGTEAIGAIYLTRQSGHTPWTDVEKQEALELGRDMGRILRSARAYRQEQQVAAELRALDTYRGNLIASVSRELAHPLSAIMTGSAALAAADGSVDHAGVEAVARAAEQMARVVDDLLLLSRIADPDARGERGPVDLGRLAEEAVVAAGWRAEGVDLSLRIEGPAVLTGRRESLSRAVRALVNFALRCTPVGGAVTVTVASTPTGVALVVADDGVGIAPEHLPRLFEEFYRVPQAGRLSEPSTGLGLAIAARTVQRHGGTIEVDSTPGAGTTVRVMLPPG